MNQRNRHSPANCGTRIADQLKPADRLCLWLIRYAARSAPPPLSERLEEEWLADLAERGSTMSRLRFALGCCWATGVIAREQSAAGFRATTAVLGAHPMIAAKHSTIGCLSHRSTAVFLVLCLHAAVFYAFMVGLSHTLSTASPSPLQNRALQEASTRQLPPLPVPTPLNRVKLEVQMPEIPTSQDVGENQIVGKVDDADSTPSVLPATPHVVKQVRGGPGTGFPNPDDYYPLLARHMEEQGMVTVQVCVDVNGRLLSDPTTLEGSGNSRLDEGALKLAKAGSGHYRATTEDGHPVNSCYPFRIRFQLKN
jgi:TonB family protein